MARDEGHAADLDSLGRGKEGHGQRIAIDGGHTVRRSTSDAGDTGMFGRDTCRQTARPGPNDEQPRLFHHSSDAQETSMI